MKTYNQSEWTAILGNKMGGHVSIRGVNLLQDGRIASVEITTRYNAHIDSMGTLYPKCVDAIGGEKQFLFENGSVSLVVDSDEVCRTTPAIPSDKMENAKIIPFKAWISDYVSHNNATHRRDEDKIAGIKIDSCRVNGNGIIQCLNARVTWAECYGCFGRLTTDRHIEIARDVLGGVYNMVRNNDIYDGWTPGCCGDYGYRAYFNKDYDIVFSDDGRYHVWNNTEWNVMAVAKPYTIAA